MAFNFETLGQRGVGERAAGVWKLAHPHLRDYQVQAIDDLVKRWDGGATRVPMVLATGLGKTEIFTPLEALWCKGSEFTERPLHEAYGLGRRVLVIAHTDELIEQAAKKARLRNPGITVGIVKAAKNETHCQIIVSSRQTLASEKRRRAIRSVGLIIIDECHHALRSNTYGKILEHFGAFEREAPPLPARLPGESDEEFEDALAALKEGEDLSPRCKVAGFTATLARGDKGKLSTVWEDVTFRRDILFGIRRGYLLDVRAEQIIIPDLDLSGVKQSRGDFQDSALAEELERRHAPENVAEQYYERARDELGRLRKGIAFWPLVETAYAAAAAFDAAGIPSAVVHGGLANDVRKKILRQFHDGEITVVHNCMVLTEGFDEPTADVVVIGRPTRSAPLYQQMVGRVLRPDLTVPADQRGKALILDVTGAGAVNDLRSLIDLSPERPLDPNRADDLSLLELDEEFELNEQQGVGNSTELFEEQYRGETLIREFDPLHRDEVWQQTADGTFFLNYPGTPARYLFLYETEPARWDVAWCTQRSGQSMPDTGEQAGLTDITGEDLEGALMLAEDEVMINGAIGSKTLTSRKSAWRRDEPSEKQKRSFHWLYTEGMSKGELSEKIDQYNATRRIDPIVRAVKAMREEEQ